MKKLMINSQDQLRLVALCEIVFCKSDNCYTSIYLENGEDLTICKSLTQLTKDLDEVYFIRVNQSYLINKNFIRLIDKKKKHIQLKTSHLIPFTTTLKELINLMNIVSVSLLVDALFS